MSRAAGDSASGIWRVLHLPAWSPPSRPRIVAVGFGVVLLWAYVSVFYHVANVTGEVRWLAIALVAALGLATVVALTTSVWGSLVVGGVLLLTGVAVYLALVPALHDEVLTVAFARRWVEYLTGVTVLDFRRAGLWAVAVAPGPVFLTWALLLRRRYDGAALAGGLMLGFFALTGDAGPTTTLVGMIGLLGILGAGTADRDAGTLSDVARLGTLLAVAVVVARLLRLVPSRGALETVGSGDSGVGGDGPGDDVLGLPFDGDLDNADERARIYGSISLSPTVLFTIEADEAVYWRVGAYDRYTGTDWIRTGGTSTYESPLAPPPGPARRVEQTVEVETRVRTLPTAWKPVAIDRVHPNRIQVTDLDGLVPTGTLLASDSYRVTSRVPERLPERLRGAGTGYPEDVRERYLQLPESTPARVGELAADLAGDAENPYDAAVAIQRWLAAEKSYDLAVERPDGDVVDAFLSSMDGGYCVYFASAMTVMLRTVDVPSRFVLGFSPGQQVEANRWVLRGLDSHAWVEVFFPGTGWVPFDPTPTTGRQSTRTQYLARARAVELPDVDTNESRAALANPSSGDLEAFAATRSSGTNLTTTPGEDANASAAAVGSDGAPADPADSPGEEPIDPASAAVDAVGDWAGDRDRLSALAGAVGLTLGLHWVGAFERGHRAVRLRWQRPTDSPRRDVECAYERLELLLTRRFRPREPSETRRGYLRAAEATIDVEGARRVLDLGERASYGGTVSRAEADEAIRIVDGLVEGDR